MKKLLFLTLALLFTHFTTFADGYWLQIQGNGQKGDTLFIKIRYGGVNEQKNRYINTGSALDKMKDFSLKVITPHATIIQIPIKQEHDCWSAYYLPLQNGIYQVIATDDKLPVVERADSTQNIKPVQYLCTTYTVANGPESKAPAPHLYLQVIQKNDTAIITPFIDNQPVPANTALRVFYPDNNDIQLNTTNQGVATLSVKQKGTYLIRLDQLIPTTGVFGGKKYYAIRHRCDYTLVVR